MKEKPTQVQLCSPKHRFFPKIIIFIGVFRTSVNNHDEAFCAKIVKDFNFKTNFEVVICNM